MPALLAFKLWNFHHRNPYTLSYREMQQLFSVPVKKIHGWVFREVPEHLICPIFVLKLHDSLSTNTQVTRGAGIIHREVVVPLGGLAT